MSGCGLLSRTNKTLVSEKLVESLSYRLGFKIYLVLIVEQTISKIVFLVRLISIGGENNLNKGRADLSVSILSELVELY